MSGLSRGKQRSRYCGWLDVPVGAVWVGGGVWAAGAGAVPSAGFTVGAGGGGVVSTGLGFSCRRSFGASLSRFTLGFFFLLSVSPFKPSGVARA